MYASIVPPKVSAEFLSSLAQDFIEGQRRYAACLRPEKFLSSLAQDFIEGASAATAASTSGWTFLSSLAQDFIEGIPQTAGMKTRKIIPELSSSGLH